MLVFVDESGYPRPNDSTKNPILLGVCISEEDIKPLTHKIFKLKDTIFSKQDEIKATSLIREQTITRHRTKNKTYVDRLVDIVCDFDIAVFAIIMETPKNSIIIPQNYLPKQYHLLLKKVEYFCTVHDCTKAIIIFDEVDEGTDRKIAESFNAFLFKAALGRTFRKILEMPLFVSSSVTPAIQIADIFAGIVRHYYENGLDINPCTTDFHHWLSDLFSKIYNKTENCRQPGEYYVEYGFQKIGANLEYHKLQNNRKRIDNT